METISSHTIRRILKLSLGFFIFFTFPVLADNYAIESAKLNSLANQIAAKKTLVDGLVSRKKQIKDPETLESLLKEIVLNHEELKSLNEEYEKQKDLVKYKFPERADQTKRKYVRHKMKSLKEIEVQLGVDGKLDKIKKKIRQQYGDHSLKGEELARFKEKQRKRKASQGNSIVDDSEQVILVK